MKSTVHVTGSPSKHTKQAIVDLFEPTPEELAEVSCSQMYDWMFTHGFYSK